MKWYFLYILFKLIGETSIYIFSFLSLLEKKKRKTNRNHRLQPAAADSSLGSSARLRTWAAYARAVASTRAAVALSLVALAAAISFPRAYRSTSVGPIVSGRLQPPADSFGSVLLYVSTKKAPNQTRTSLHRFRFKQIMETDSHRPKDINAPSKNP